jgi:beta-lactam-binding protein with PASTA domain
MSKRRPSADHDDDTPAGPPGLFGTLWRLGLVGGFLFLLAGIAGYGVVYHYVKQPEVQAPDLLALSETEAFRQASELGFAARVSARQESDFLETGAVMGQNPAPGTWVKTGATLSLIVAE